MTRATQSVSTRDAGSAPMTRGESEHDDAILPETRWLAAFIVPFLVVAFALLYGWPDDTARLFAWTIRPRMTPMLMGAGYIAGAYFFVRVLAGGRLSVSWHRVTCGFLPVTAFASSMAVATALHWDRFNHAHVSFYAWVFLYAIAPPLVAGVWLRNRRRDPATVSASDAAVPRVVRLTVGAVGALILVFGLCLFVTPSLLLAVWPWTLTPLTARVLGGWFALPGVAGLVLSRDQRWSAWGIPLQSQAFGIVLILIGVVRAWSTFDPAGAGIWLFVGGMGALLAGIFALYRSMESHHAFGPNRAQTRLV
jgi:hypothetical protein